MSYLVIDPGLTSGFALFDSEGVLELSWQRAGTIGFGKHLRESLSLQPHWHRVLYETYKIFPWVKQGGSDVPAARLIGVIQDTCEELGISCEGIDPRYKRIGYAWSGTKQPRNHAKSHAPDAVALGEYWLRKNGVKDINA